MESRVRQRALGEVLGKALGLLLLLAACNASEAPQGAAPERPEPPEPPEPPVPLSYAEEGAGLVPGTPGNDVPDGPARSRRKRYIVFPKGSSIQAVADFTVRTYVPFTNVFSLGAIYSMAWRLPSEAASLLLTRRSAEDVADTQGSDHVYLTDLAGYLDKLGLHGEHCVQRTICDYRSVGDKKGSFMVEMLRAFFKISDEDSYQPIKGDVDIETTECEKLFPRCTSVLDIPLLPNDSYEQMTNKV